MERNQLVIKSIPNRTYTIGLFLISLVFLIVGLGIITNLLINLHFPSEMEIVSCLISLFLGVWVFVKSFVISVLSLFDDRLEVTSYIFKYHLKTIYKKDIIGWAEKSKTISGNNPHTYYVLTIYTNNNKYKIVSDLYSEYYQLKHLLIPNVSQKNISVKIGKVLKSKILYASTLLIGIFLLCSSIYVFSLKDLRLSDKDIVEINGTIINEIKIIRTRRGGYLAFWLSEYIGFEFRLERNIKILEDTNFLQKVKTGSRITLGVEANDYYDTILDKKSNNLISVYTISANDQNYITLNDYNRLLRRSYFAKMIGFFILGLVIIFYSLYHIRKISLRENLKIK